MSAELFINLPVLSFAEQMQIDLTHDRAVLIGIAHQKLGSVQCYNAQLIIEIARCARHSCAKKTVALNFLGRDRPGCLSIRHDFDLARIGPENPENTKAYQHSKFFPSSVTSGTSMRELAHTNARCGCDLR